MEWTDVAKAVGEFAPIIGTLLGGPAGGAIGSLVASGLGVANTPDAVSQALATNPDAAVKLAQIEADEKVKFQELATDQAKAEIAAEVQTTGDINQTMQAEDKAEHWPQYSWRPAVGFAVAISVLVSAITIPLVYGAAIQGYTTGLQYLSSILAAEAGIIAVASPILGIASWHRGKMQVAATNNEVK